MTGPRFAIYYAPEPQSALWRFGSSVIGYDAASGNELASLAVAGLDAAGWARLIEDPRRYGFHATLKAPFHLLAGRTRDELIAALEAFARARRAVRLGRLQLSAIGAFLTLQAPDAGPELEAFAQDVVEAFEPFRAPLDQGDRQRRLAASLSDRQRDYLDRFGYPYVGEEFCFHMTLAGPVEPAMRATVLAALAARYAAEVMDAPTNLERIVLFEQQRRDSAFRIVAASRLG